VDPSSSGREEIIGKMGNHFTGNGLGIDVIFIV
jgi:hypothetical protein